MSAVMRFLCAAVFSLFILLPAHADVSSCACDPSKPETLEVRNCSLCREAEKQPQDADFFVLKDINPRKPNRWLVLPRVHDEGAHHMHRMSAAERIGLWKRSVKEAHDRFGDAWGLAYNGSKVRTQCHLHIHVGRWVTAAENTKFKVVRRIEDFPAPLEGGILIHPVKGGYHVHTGEEIMETALVR